MKVVCYIVTTLRVNTLVIRLTAVVYVVQEASGTGRALITLETVKTVGAVETVGIPSKRGSL